MSILASIISLIFTFLGGFAAPLLSTDQINIEPSISESTKELADIDENSNNAQDTESMSDYNSEFLKVEVIEEGTGNKQVEKGDEILIHYTGTLEDGTKFDSSVDRGTPLDITIGVGMVIKGWDEGIIGMKVGEKRKLTIQPDYGYGAAGAGAVIPPNAVLIFDVELVDVK